MKQYIFRYAHTYFLLLLISLHSFAGGSASPQQEFFQERTTYPILQGMTDSSSTQISVLLPVTQKYKVIVKSQKKQIQYTPQTQEWKTIAESQWGVLKQYYKNLNSNDNYELQVLGESGQVLDQREFNLIQLDKLQFRIVIASCLDDEFIKEQASMWGQIELQKPELIFLIGDNVYGDKINGEKVKDLSPDMLWKRYVQTFVRLDLFHQKKLIPIIATWDDHDFGGDEGNRTYKNKEKTKKIFETFFAQNISQSIAFERGLGVSSLLKTKGINFYFMDGRSFRFPGETHWGVEQEAWLYKNLKKTAKASWVINGDQFFGGYHQYESYEGSNPKSFKNFLKKITKISSKIFFISGDRHLTELMEVPKIEIGYKTYELTTSAIHAKVYSSQWSSKPNPRQIIGVAGMQNYALVSVNAQNNKQKIDLKVFTHQGKVLYERELLIE